MITCTKKFGPYPFAHRQPLHTGHCRLLHGHNFYFELTFAAKELDANGFVQDFGHLDWLKTWLTKQFDHKLGILHNDPFLETFCALEAKGLCKLTPLDDGSAEGLARYVCESANLGFVIANPRQVRVIKVICFEDEKNSATYEP